MKTLNAQDLIKQGIPPKPAYNIAEAWGEPTTRVPKRRESRESREISWAAGVCSSFDVFAKYEQQRSK